MLGGGGRSAASCNKAAAFCCAAKLRKTAPASALQRSALTDVALGLGDDEAAAHHQAAVEIQHIGVEAHRGIQAEHVVGACRRGEVVAVKA